MGELIEELQQLRLTDYRCDAYHLPLEILASRAGLKLKSKSKNSLVAALSAYLSDEKNIHAIWDGLDALERAIVTDAMINQHYLLKERANELSKEMNQQLKEKTKMSLFFINGYIPVEIGNILIKFIQRPHINVNEQKLNGKLLRNYSVYRYSEDQWTDWTNIVKFASTGKFKVTKAGNFPTKAALNKINEIVVAKEYETENISLVEAKNGADTHRLYGLYKTMVAANVLALDGTTVILGDEAKAFLSASYAKQAEMLFEAYKNNVDYDEITRIPFETFEPDRACSEKVRQSSINLLSGLQEGKWIKMDELSEQLYKCWRTFIMQYVGSITEKSEYSGYYRDYFEGDWERLERPYLDVFLIEGLGALGIVDLALEEEEIEKSFFDIDWRLKVAYFKLTPLGAYLFGKNKDFKDPSAKGRLANDLCVDENMHIRVGNSLKRYQHEIFFDKFCQKDEKEDYTEYVLDFAAALNAFNEDISLDEILSYLQKECTKEIPPQVELVIHQWKQDQHKVKIRKVTIIECEDERILNDLMESKQVVKCGAKKLVQALEIEAGSEKKVKKEIEKKNYFCKIIGQDGGKAK